MSGEYGYELDASRGIALKISFATRRRQVIDYAVVLTAQVDGRVRTVRVYDGAHGRNELHRFTRTQGKQPAELFHAGTLGEGMRAAIGDCHANYDRMVEVWFR